MFIETSRLIIKPIDEFSFTKSMNILKNNPSFSNIPRIYSKYNMTKFLQLNDKIRSFNSFGYLSITLKKNLNQIGIISLLPRYLNEILINELGYIIEPVYRHNGFAFEAIINTLNFAYVKTSINEVYCIVNEDNKISSNIMQKLRFDVIDTLLDINIRKTIYKLDKIKFFNKVLS